MALIEMVPRFNPEGDYRLMTEQVLPELGFSPEAAGVPALEQVAARLLPLSNWLEDRARAGITDRLVIVPRVGGEEGMGVSGLIIAHDLRAYREDRSFIDTVWGGTHNEGGQLADKSPDHDNGLESMCDVAVLLGDEIDRSSGRAAHDPGLMHTNMTAQAQRSAHDLEVEIHRQAGRNLVSVTVGQLVVDSQALKAEGVLQRDGITRLIHYPHMTVDGYSRIPSVFSSVSRLCFRDSDNASWRNVGVRRAVRV